MAALSPAPRPPALGAFSLLLDAFDQSPSFIAVLAGPEHVFEYVNAAYLQLIGHRDPVGRSVREALPEVEGQGFFERLDGVFETAEPWRGDEVPIQLARAPGDALEERFVDFVYQPIRGDDGATRGVLAHGVDVTERVRARLALAEREARLRTLFATMDQGFCLCEMVVDEAGRPADYRFLEVNDAFAAMSGLEDATGRTARELVPGLEDDWIETYARVGFGGERLRLQQGSAAMGRWFDVFAAPAEPVGSGRFVVVFTDVSGRRVAEVALRESEHRARLALDVARVGTYDWDLVADTIVFDARGEEIAGLPAGTGAAVFPAVFASVVHPDDAPRVQASLEAAFAGDDEWHAEHRVVHAGGAVRHIATRARVEYEGEGDARRAVRLAGVLVDVTAEREAEAALRESEQRARLALDIASLGTFEWDVPADAITFDARGREIVGLPPGDDAVPVSSVIFASVIHPDDAPRVQASLAAALEDGGEWHASHRVVHAGGAVRHIATRARVLHDGDGVRLAGAFRDVTAEREAEAALRESEERARLALDAADVGVWSFDHDRATFAFDERARRAYGFGAGPVPLDAFLGRVHPEDRDGLARMVAEAFSAAGHERYEVEYRVVHPDGAVHYLDVRTRLRFEGEGDARHAVASFGTVADVTERREASARLHASEERLRHALEAGGMGTWEQDLVTGAFTADDRFRALWALGPDTPGAPFDFYGRVHPDDVGRLRTHVERALAEGTAYDVDFRVVLPHGDVRWVAGPGRAELGADGRPARIAGINFDITERRRADEALRASEAFARSLTEASPDCLKVLDLDGRLVSINTQGLCLMEIDHFDAVEGDYWPDYWPDARDAARAAVDEALAGRIGSFTGSAPTYKGTMRWWDVRVAPVVDGDGRVAKVLVASRDVTGQAETQNALRELNGALEARVAERTAALEEANAQLEVRNRELQDFAHVASHDLQEPLRKIRSFAGLLATDEAPRLTDEGRHYIERTQAAAERMSGLIRDLLAFSRVASKQNPSEAVDLDDALRGVLRDLDASLEASGGRVEAAPLGSAHGDPIQIRQVLQNLVGNALKYHRPGAPPAVRVRTERSGGQVRIVVEDEGIGFEPKHAERIFAPFQRLHGRGEYEGTGMGLAIVRRVAERHGGSVTAEGRPGEGATFTVTLPEKG